MLNNQRVIGFDDDDDDGGGGDDDDILMVFNGILFWI
jgi:hypothetical protein